MGTNPFRPCSPREEAADLKSAQCRCKSCRGYHFIQWSFNRTSVPALPAKQSVRLRRMRCKSSELRVPVVYVVGPQTFNLKNRVQIPAGTPITIIPDRLRAGRRTLNPKIMVRIHVREPTFQKACSSIAEQPSHKGQDEGAIPSGPTITPKIHRSTSIKTPADR